MHIDLNRLRVFVHVYENNSIVRAATELHITRSAVSQHLKKCEEELGVKLFTRQHTKLIATSRAKRLNDIVKPFLYQLDSEIMDIKQGHHEPIGELRIGAPHEFGKIYLPQIIAGFRHDYNKVTFSLYLGDTESLKERVKTGDLDIALIDVFFTENLMDLESETFNFKPIINEEVVMICSKEYFSEHISHDNSLKTLLKKDFITYRQNNIILKSWFKHHYKTRSPNISVVFTVDNVRAVVSAVENHIGLGVVPYHVVRDEVESGKIVTIPSAKDNIINNISLLQLQDKIPTIAEKYFVSYFCDCIADEKGFS